VRAGLEGLATMMKGSIVHCAAHNAMPPILGQILVDHGCEGGCDTMHYTVHAVPSRPPGARRGSCTVYSTWGPLRPLPIPSPPGRSPRPWASFQLYFFNIIILLHGIQGGWDLGTVQ
jgi:hypothetical protein